MSQLLLISSTAALILLVVHSWRTRGRFVTLAFFTSGILFGVVRGNVVWYLCRFLSADPSADFKPYVPQEGLIPQIGNESLQVAVGWVFALYLAWTVSEMILRRLPKFSGRVFMTTGLASVFMLAICWCMETTAVTVGWWYWNLPTHTTLFGSVNVPGMEAWFSVVPDFLIPFLVIACSAAGAKGVRPLLPVGPEGASHKRGLTPFSLLWLLVFPLHMLGHLAYAWFSYAYLIYAGLELLVVALMMFSALRMARGEMRASEGDRVSGGVLAAALAIFFGVVVAANVSAGAAPEKPLTVLPLLMLSLLAWRRVKVEWVLALSLLSVVGWAWMGPRVLWVLAPVGVYCFLAVLDRLREPLWLRLVPPVAAIALSALAAFLFEADKVRTARYMESWAEGDRLALSGSDRDAAPAYDLADRSRPHNLLHFYEAVRRMMRIDPQSPDATLLYQRRIPRIVRELEEVVRRDPEGVPPRRDLVYYDLLEGRIADAAETYREMHRLRPRDADIAAMSGYLLLREGKAEEAEAACAEALRSEKRPVEALINLGVIRLSRGDDAEAHKLWQEALARQPEPPMAGVNIERLKDISGNRDIDMRYLARDGVCAHLAPWVNNLAARGAGYSADDRVRLLLEATQLDPTFLPPQLNLVRLYLQDGRRQDKERALWHARRAVAIARDSQQGAALAQSLLALGEALVAGGRQDDARRALEEGKTSAPPEMAGQFDRALDALKDPPK